MVGAEEQMPRVSAGAKTPESSLSERLSGPALEAFTRIAGHWRLSTAEQRTLLGGLAESTYFKYLKNPKAARLSADTLERISHLIGIFKSINVLLPRAEAADTWVRRPNNAPLFKGRSALDYVLSGRFEDLIAVRHYLDAMRGW
jgi:uncharacterized protein (DUF2384 family)